MERKNVDIVRFGKDNQYAVIVANGQDTPEEVVAAIRDHILSQMESADDPMALAILNPSDTRNLAQRLLDAADNVEVRN